MFLGKALRGTIVAFVCTIIAGLFWYIFRMLLARNLTVAEYGTFFAVYSFVAFLTLIVDVGFAQAVPKFIIDYIVDKKNKEVGSLIFTSLIFHMVASIVIFGIIMLFSGWLSRNYFHADVKNYLFVMGIWFVLYPIAAFIYYVFLGFQKFALAAAVDPARAVFMVVVSFVLLTLGYGVYAPMMGYAIMHIFSLLVFAVPLRRTLASYAYLKFTSWKTLFSVLKYGFFVSLSSLVWTVLTQLDTLMLTYYSGPEAVGLYQVAVPLASVSLYLVTAIGFVAYPLASELFARKNFAELREGVGLFYKYIFVALMPLVMILFAFSSLIITILFGAKYQGAATALQILSLGALFSSTTLFNNNIFSAIGKPHVAAKLMGYVVGINVILNVVLIPKLGLVGAAIATSVSFFASMVLSIVSLRRRISMKIPVIGWIKTFLLGAVTTLIIYVIKYFLKTNVFIEAAIVSIIAAVIYAAGCFALRIIKIEEILYLWNNIKK